MSAVSKGLVIPILGDLYVKNCSELDDYHEVVGGWIEAVNFPEFTMYINEEGKVKNHPINYRATLLWLTHFGPTDMIVGPVILFNLPADGDIEGNDRDLKQKSVAGSITGKNIVMCDICRAFPAMVDMKTLKGSWAYMCGMCASQHSVQRVGTGFGQILCPESVWEELA